MKIGEIPLMALVLFVPFLLIKEHMLWAGLVLLAEFLWFVIGCGVLSGMDDKEHRLFKWAQACPLGYTWVPMLWPLVVLYLRRRSQSS